MKIIRRIAAIATLALALLASTVPAKAQFLPVYGSNTFIKGANLAWLNGAYSNYLGVDPHNPSWGVSYNSSSMNAHLADMHNMGITVVRLWLFQDDQGCTLDGSGDVTGVTSQFWTNLDDTVRLAGNNHIALYLCLNNGRADFLTNSTMLNDFINNALRPLVQRYYGDQRIWAIDAMNEIDGVVGGSQGNYGSGPSWSQAQNYIRSIASAVHSADYSRMVSCSTGWHSWTNLGYFKGLGLDFYDFHLYNDNGYIPSASSLGMDKPIYVGETGQSTTTWNDAAQNTEMSNILNNARNGYAGVGIWDYEYAGSTDIYSMLYSNGSWRPVDYTIQAFNYGGSGGSGGGGNLVANGTYSLICRNGGEALDVPGWSTAGGVQLDQWASSGNNNQRFQLTNLGNNVVSLINVNSNKAVEVYGFSTANGAEVDQWPYWGGVGQQWKVASAGGGYYTLTNLNSGQNLDVSGASTANGALIDQWPSNGGYNQQWSFH